MKSTSVSKGRTGRNKTSTLVNLVSLDKIDSSSLEALKDFVSRIRVASKDRRDDKKTPDAQAQKSLDECFEMLTYASQFATLIKLIFSVVAYKISAEELWRGKYPNKIACITELTELEESTIHRYIACGRVVKVLTDAQGFTNIPKSLDALTPFSRLKDKKDMLKAFEIALADSRDEPITKASAEKAISKLLDKPAKTSTNCNAAKTASSTKSEKKQALTLAKETAIELGKQIQKFGKETPITFSVIEPLLRSITSSVTVYLKKKHKLEYLEKLTELTGKLHCACSNAFKQHPPDSSLSDKT